MLLGAAAIMSGCGGGPEKKAGEEKKGPRVLVTTGTTVMEKIDRTVQFTSNIEPAVKNNIAGLQGRISKILVDVGARVERGQLLAVMDQTQYTTTSVQLSNLQQDYARMKSVYDAGGTSKQQIDQLETQIKMQEEQLRNLKENTELRSPISGVVTARNYDPGDQASGLPVLTVMQINNVKVTINISEQYFTQVKVGTPVSITADVLGDREFKGRVTLVYPTIDAMSRTFTVEVTIPNGRAELRPGMFSRATINFGQGDAVLVDDLAVQKQTGTNERYVFVIENNSVARRRTVTLGRQIGSRIVVESGLEAGEVVALTGQTRLINGSQVEIK